MQTKEHTITNSNGLFSFEVILNMTEADAEVIGRGKQKCSESYAKRKSDVAGKMTSKEQFDECSQSLTKRWS